MNVGDRIYVFSVNSWYLYRVHDINTVLPSDVSVIDNTSVETLTLYTCSGYADLKRLIVKAIRILN